MKNAYGKLTLLAFVLALGVMLFAPMRSGMEDELSAAISEVVLQVGEMVNVPYELRAETAQIVTYSSDSSYVASVDQQGTITAVSPGSTKVRIIAQGGAADSVNVKVEGVALKSFALNTHELDMNKGDTSGLSYKFNYGATAQSVAWYSADPAVVQVDEAGRIKAVGSGETYVVATTASGLSDRALVRVHVRGTSVRIAPEALTVGVGSVVQLGATYVPEDATDVSVRWSSSAPRVFAVDENGLARAVSAGTAAVTVETRDGLRASATVIVETAAKGMKLNLTEAVIERGETQALEAGFIDANGNVDADIKHHVEWRSSDPGVATVKNGLVTAVSSGDTVITASADGFEDKCKIHVQTSVSEVHLNVTEQTLYQNQTDVPFQIKATVVPEDADDTKLSYSSNNPLVAKVSETGLVKMTGGYGTAVITVEASNGTKAACTVHVVVSPETESDEQTE